MERQFEQQIKVNDNVNLNQYLKYFDMNFLYGQTYRKQLKDLKVLLYGFTTIGPQIAKNLIAHQIKTITIIINSQKKDQSINSSINYQKINKKLTQDSINGLKQLNPNVEIKVLSNKNQSIEFIVQEFDCIVMIDQYDGKFLNDINLRIRKQNKIMIIAGVIGMYGYCFNDFGDQFSCWKYSQRQIRYPMIIRYIQNLNDKIKIIELNQYFEQYQRLQQGQIIRIQDAFGLQYLNNQTFKVIDSKPYINQIQKTNLSQKYSILIQSQTQDKQQQYRFGAKLYKINSKILLNHQSFHQTISQKTQMYNLSQNLFNYQLNRQTYLHQILKSIYQFYSQNQRFPSINNTDLQLIYQNIKKNNQSQSQMQFKDINELCKLIITTKQIIILPICQFFGGIVTNQILKARPFLKQIKQKTLRAKPIKQWFHYDFFNILPQQSLQFINQQQIQIQSDQLYKKIFGSDFNKKTKDLRIFLQCSKDQGFLIFKSLQSLGFCQQKKGKLLIKNKQIIKKIVQNKTCNNIKQKEQKSFNQKNQNQIQNQVSFKVNLIEVQEKQIVDSCKLINDTFWSKIDFAIIGSWSRIMKSKFDDKSIILALPFIQFQIKQFRGHSQPIIPFQTESLSEKNEQIDKEHDLSSVRNFSSHKAHAFEQAKYQFKNIIQMLQDTRKSYLNKQQFCNQLRNKLNKRYINVALNYLDSLLSLIQINETKSIEKTIFFILNLFNEIYYENVQAIIESIGDIDVKGQNNKQQYFWKRNLIFPKPFLFDKNNQLHLYYVFYFYKILSNCFHLQKANHSFNQFCQIISQFIQKYQYQYKCKPVNSHYFKLSQQERIKLQKSQQQQMNKKIEKLGQFQLNNKNVSQEFVEMETNQDQFQFVYVSTKLRAYNFNIKGVDQQYIRTAYQKRNPQSICTISTIVGSVILELLRYILRQQCTFISTFANMETSIYSFSQTPHIKINKFKQYDPLFDGSIDYIPKNVSKWYHLQYEQVFSLRQLRKEMKAKFGVKIIMVWYKSVIIYSQLSTRKEENDFKRINEILFDKGMRLQEGQKYITLGAFGQRFDGVDIQLSPIKMKL